MIKPGDQCGSVEATLSTQPRTHQFRFSHREPRGTAYVRLYYCIWCLGLAEGEGS